MIYLDHHAAAPPSEAVIDAMARARREGWANPSSAHAAGRAARAMIERARDTVATAVGARAADVVFTAGGTEACNLGVLGLASAHRALVSTPFEHPAVAAPIEQLVSGGATLRTLCATDALGGVDSLLKTATFIAVQWINHETGTILPVEALVGRARAAGARTFVDATQALGKVPIDLAALSADAVAFASSKLGGPPGVGALVVDRRIAIEARAIGGGQERGRRAGTPDPVGIVGFAAALAELEARLAAQPSIAERRDRLERFLVDAGAVVNRSLARAATVTNVSFAGWKGPRLVAALDLEGVAVSHGAACSSGVDEPSPSVRALYPDEPWRAENALRLSLGPSTTDADIDEACARIARVLARK